MVFKTFIALYYLFKQFGNMELVIYLFIFCQGGGMGGAYIILQFGG